MSFIAYFHDYAFHIILVHSHYLMFSHDFVFMSLICALYILSVNCWAIFMFSWIYTCFIPYLKDLGLVFKIIIKLARILHFGRVFKHVKIILKSYFWKPYHLRVAGWAIMHCMLKLKIFVNMCMKGRYYEFYTWSSLYFQLVSQLILLSLYTHICVFYICIVSNFQ